MAAEVSGPDSIVSALTPDCLELIGRGLIRGGESVFLIDTSSGRIAAYPRRNPRR